MQSAKLLATILHLHQGTPYIYQGEEIGMTNTKFHRIEDFRDVESINYYREATTAHGRKPKQVLANLEKVSRDNARTPMQWTNGDHAGFSTSEPWISVNPNYLAINVEAERSDPESILHYYRHLIQLRHEEQVIVDGDFTLLLPDYPIIHAFTRRSAKVELLVLGNFSSRTVTIPIPVSEWKTSAMLISNYPESTDMNSGSPKLQLRPWETRVYKRILT